MFKLEIRDNQKDFCSKTHMTQERKKNKRKCDEDLGNLKRAEEGVNGRVQT